jgi:hypothetical protein
MIQPVLAAALLLTQAAAPAERSCITPEEAGDVAVSLLPFLIDAAAERCRPHLAPTAFLAGSGARDWSERLRRESAPRRAAALRGISKVGGATPPAGAEGEAAFGFVAQLLTGGLVQSITPENCGQVDTIVQALSPLPTDNIARLIGAGAALAANARAQAEAAAAANPQTDDADDADEPGGDGPPICRS